MITDLCGACGVLMIGWGLWQVHPPAAWMAVGLLLLAGACSYAANRRRERELRVWRKRSLQGRKRKGNR